jgi:integrase
MSELKSIPWKQFTSEVLALYTPPIRRPGTYRKTDQVLREFKRHCKTTADVDPVAIAKWIAAHPKRKASTRLALLRTLRPACTYGANAGYLVDPFEFRKPRQWLPASELGPPETLFPRHRSAAEIQAVLAQADSEALAGRWEALRLRAAVYTWCYMGARKSEILGALAADVDLQHGLLSIRSNDRRPLKTAASAATIPLAEPLAAVLADWLPRCGSVWLLPHKYRKGPWLHGPYQNKCVDQVAQLGARAGVHGLTVLALRHSFGTLSESWGWGSLALQRMLRHTESRTQLHYRHEDLEQMRRAASKIRYDGPH